MPDFRLRPLITLVVLLGVGALAGLMALTSTKRVSDAYARGGEAQLQAIATTFEDGFTAADLADPASLQRRIERLRAGNEEIHKISISWHGEDGRTYLVSTGHEHDPDGSKRDVTTSRALASPRSAKAAPIDQAAYGLREVRSSDGVHYAELNYAIGLPGGRGPVAALELHYDLKARDAALRADRTAILVAALAGASLLGLLISAAARPPRRAPARPDPRRRQPHPRRRQQRTPALEPLGRDRRAGTRLRRARRRPARGAQGPAHRPPQPSRLPGAPGPGAQPRRARGARRWRSSRSTSTTSRSSTTRSATPPATTRCCASRARSARSCAPTTSAAASAATSS